MKISKSKMKKWAEGEMKKFGKRGKENENLIRDRKDRGNIKRPK